MNLIKYEAYKLFIKRRLLLILTVCIAAEAVTAYNSAEKAKIDNYESQQKYEYYISVYAGELTEEKQNEINSLIEKDESITDEKKQLVQSYVAREITDREYEEKLKTYNEYSIGHNGFEMFVQDFQNAAENKTYLIDQRPWNVLFGNESIDFILVLFIIISVVLLSVYDEESGANSITFPTVRGKKHKWLSHFVILIMTAAFMSVAISVVRYVIINIAYGFNNCNFRIGNIDLFYKSERNLTLIQGYILISAIKIFGAVYLAVTAYFIGAVFKQSLLTIFSSFTLTFLPNYIFPDREYKYLIPFPSAFLTANGYLFGDQINDIVYFKSLNIMQIVLIISIAAAISVVFMLISYFKTVRRKSL